MKTDKHVYQAGTSSKKMQITTLICCSASGYYIPPLVYPGVQPRVELQETFHRVFPGALFGNSESGWMDSQFREYLENGFDVALVENKVHRPVLLLIDGARCHLSIEASEFCDVNAIYLYTLYPNATYIIQPLDLVLMGLLKKNYCEEMKKWLIDHIGQVFDKYEFIEVFASTYKLSATLENAKKGFEVASLHPWNPSQANTKKLAPASLYKPENPLPEVAADSSMVEEPQPSTSTNNEVPNRSPTPADVAPVEMFVKEPMIVKIGAKKFCLVEEAEEDTVEGKEDKIKKILDVPKTKSRMGGVRVSGLPRCVSSQKFRDAINAAKEKKKQQHEAIEKRKAKCKENAEAKKKEKEAAAAMKALKRNAKGRGKKRIMKKKVIESSTDVEDDIQVEYEDSSEYESEDDYLDSHCAECDTRFTGETMKTVIGCNSTHCGRWYHRGCTDLLLDGKSEREIQAMLFVCRYC